MSVRETVRERERIKEKMAVGTLDKKPLASSELLRDRVH